MSEDGNLVSLETEHEEEDFVCAIHIAGCLKKFNTGNNGTKTNGVCVST